MRRAHLIAATFLSAGALAACGTEDGDDTTDTDPAPASDAATLLATAFDPHSEIDSGTLDLALTAVVDQQEEAGGNFDLTMVGPFESPDGVTPSFALETTAQMTNTDPAVSDDDAEPTEGRLISTGDAGYLVYDQYAPLAGNYELDSSLYDVIAGAVGGAPSFPSLITDAEVEGTGDVDGDETTLVTGDIDPDELARGVNALVGTAGDLGFDGLDPAAELPPQRVEALAGLVESAEAEIYIGADGGLLRRLVIDAELTGVDVEEIEITIDAQVSNVNQPVQIEAPTDTEPLSNLLKKLGQLFGALS